MTSLPPSEADGLVGAGPQPTAPTNRVTQEYQVVEAASLKPYPGNPKTHDIDALAESIDETGFYGAVIVQKSTGYILAGHGRVEALLAKGETDVPAMFVDVDDEQARKIVLADNRISQLGGWDDTLLQELLADTAETYDLTGTGYDTDFLDQLTGERVLDAQPFLGGYAETAEEIIERAQRVAHTKVAAGIHETVLVFTATEWEQFQQDIEFLKEHLDQQSTSDTVLVACKMLATQARDEIASDYGA